MCLPVSSVYHAHNIRCTELGALTILVARPDFTPDMLLVPQQFYIVRFIHYKTSLTIPTIKVESRLWIFHVIEAYH